MSQFLFSNRTFWLFCISFLPLDLILLTKRQVKSVAVYQYLLIASFFFKRRHFDFKPNLFYLSCFGSTVLAAVISINRHEINFFFKKVWSLSMKVYITCQ